MEKLKKSQPKDLPKTYWILHKDQVTQSMVNFLKLTKERMTDVSLEFKILATEKGSLEIAAPLRPSAFNVNSYQYNDPLKNFIKKRDAIGEVCYSEGLPVWRALLLDDLGGTKLLRHESDLSLDGVKCIVVQIPSVLSSTYTVEHVFQSVTLLSKKKGIPIIGMEFFPLNTPWTLAASLLDGVISTRESSYDHISGTCSDTIPHIWLLPRYEAHIFFPDCPPFWDYGPRTALEYQNAYNIPPDRAVLYMPHHVAQTYEYRKILQCIGKIGKNFHLMLGIGKDVTRGTYTQREIIEKVYENELKDFSSFSFHDARNAVEMSMADGVIAACESGTTNYSSTYGIPTIIINEEATAGRYKNKKIVNTLQEMEIELMKIVEYHNKTTGLTDILSQVVFEGRG